jgi:hypothetical protein
MENFWNPVLNNYFVADLKIGHDSFPVPAISPFTISEPYDSKISAVGRKVLNKESNNLCSLVR